MPYPPPVAVSSPNAGFKQILVLVPLAPTVGLPPVAHTPWGCPKSPDGVPPRLGCPLPGAAPPACGCMKPQQEPH